MSLVTKKDLKCNLKNKEFLTFVSNHFILFIIISQWNLCFALISYAKGR